MKNLKNNLIKISFLLIGILSIASCNDQDSEQEPEINTQHFLYINNLGRSSFLGTFKDLTVKSTDNKEAFEYQFGIYPFVYENMVFIADGNFGDKIAKYIRNVDGTITKAGEIIFDQASMPGEISFLDATTAYVSLKGRGKIAIFNPTNLERKGEIDLAKYAIKDNNPDPGCNVLRDGKLFVTLNQLISKHNSVEGAVAQIAIIDIATKKVEKVITDDRVRVVGLFRHSTITKDEKGDLYFYSQGMEGMSALKDGFLRIKKGSTEFDSDYHFKLSEEKINITNKGDLAISFILPSFYSEKGITYASVNIPSLATGSSREHFITDKNYQPIKIDLWNKTVTKIDLPLSTSMGAFAMTKQGDNIIFGLVTKVGSGYYTYNTKTQKCSQKPAVTTVGSPSDIITFK